eukprot:scaffold8165_cov13-Tisochrysis_lutea.AAC.1
MQLRMSKQTCFKHCTRLRQALLNAGAHDTCKGSAFMTFWSFSPAGPFVHSSSCAIQDECVSCPQTHLASKEAEAALRESLGKEATGLAAEVTKVRTHLVRQHNIACRKGKPRTGR